MTTEIPRYLMDRLQSPEQGPDGQWWAFCPCHFDGKKSGRRSLSLTVKDGKLLMHCFAGCSFEEIAKTLAIRPSGEEKKREGVPKRRKKIEAVYDYQDADGRLRLQVVRYSRPSGGKEFRQRQPGGNGGHIWNAKGVPPLIYRLPEILKAIEAGDTIFIAEGEKAVDALVAAGLNATCSPGGAGKFRKQHAASLKGARVVILPDNDEPGERHAQAVARSLQGVAQETRILRLPGLPEKGDVYDWLEGGGTKERLLELAAQAPLAEVDHGDPDESEGKRRPDLSKVEGPIIHSDQGQLWQVSDAAIEAVVAGNTPPHLYQRSGCLVRVKKDERGPSFIEVVGENALRGILARSATWVKGVEERVTDARPGLDVVRDVLSLSEWPFPILEAVIECPVVRPDGSVLDSPGYDAATKLMLSLPNGFSLPRIPERPTQEHARRAASFLQKELLGDFPFQNESARANALGLLLTPVVRPMIQGCIPLAVITSPQAGSGKSLLSEIISITATGRSACMTSAPEDPRGSDEEWRKKLLALLLAGSSIVVIDNLERPLKSPSLASILTSTIWTDRLLGYSKQISVPNRACFIVTGCNVQVQGDLPRRSYPIGIDPQQPRPWERKGFRHSNLPMWVQDVRGDILAALLVMARSWIQAGKPKAEVPQIGGFSEWAEIIGSVLEFAGEKSFLGDLTSFYDETNQDEVQWMNFLEAWQRISGDPITVADLADFVAEARDERRIPTEEARNLNESLPPPLGEAFGRSVDSFKRQLGNALGRRQKVRYPNGLSVHKRQDSHKKIARWQVCGVSADLSPQAQPVDSEKECTTAAGSAGSCAPLTHKRGSEGTKEGGSEYRTFYRDKGKTDPADPADPANSGQAKINVTQEGLI